MQIPCTIASNARVAPMNYMGVFDALLAIVFSRAARSWQDETLAPCQPS
ncbi:MAG: hypothetical protein GYA24_11235 [Candidatus Lokiarchaeota archaeon]|nr:hypothetical protein [Candidatus Lokiarchaeota archaeon]